MTSEDIKNGFWPTVKEAIPPLLPHLCKDWEYEGVRFIEPCAGAGDLVRLLEAQGFRCHWKSDIAPKKGSLAYKFDALDLFNENGANLDVEVLEATHIITNPPFSRHHEKILREMIDRFSKVLPTWLLLPAGFAHNRRSVKHSMQHCRKIVSIGRLNWVDNTIELSRKDYAWYLFDQSTPQNQIEFYPNYGGNNASSI